MTSQTTTLPKQAQQGPGKISNKTLTLLSMPILAIITAFILNGIIIWATSGFNLQTVIDAYSGLINGAFFKERALSETLIATSPYVLLSLGLAIGFRGGLFNIGVEGQFFIGSLTAAWVGLSFRDLPGIIHLPLSVAAGALGGAIWAGIPGFLKAKTGAHEVITTMMMNYIAFRFSEFAINVLKDPASTATQTRPVAVAAQVWTLAEIPKRLEDPGNALLVAIVLGLVFMLVARWLLGLPTLSQRFQKPAQKRIVWISAGILFGLLTFFVLPPLSKAWWPFRDPYDRLHIGIFIAFGAAIFTWWLLWKTTLGFEIRMVGSNPNAARYAGINITRNTILTMALSGAMAGLAGGIEVLGVTSCRCMQVFFISGYGFDAIAIALLAKNDPIGILASAFLFGAMRNGADLMELRSGVSKYIISLIQALVLLFIAAPAIIRWIYRIRGAGTKEEQTPLTRGWGGG